MQENLKTEEQSLETVGNISSGAGVRGNQNKTDQDKIVIVMIPGI